MKAMYAVDQGWLRFLLKAHKRKINHLTINFVLIKKNIEREVFYKIFLSYKNFS